MPATVTNTELGTRVLVLRCGVTFTVTKGESDEIILADVSIPGTDAAIPFYMSPDEVLSLIGSLAVAARAGTGRAIIDAGAGVLELESETDG